MALTAADIRIFNVSMGLGAIGAHGDLFVQAEEPPFDFTGKDHVRAGICHDNIGNRACFAVFNFPRWGGISNQAAFLMVAATVIITVEIWAFFSCGWHSHDFLT
jgi:hypothetical protein